MAQMWPRPKRSERIVFAHRGLNRQAPENTMAAFQRAAEAGCTWLEMDVDLLGDGTPVVLHDSTLSRTTNLSASMYGLSASDLSTVDAGSWFSPEFAGEPIPLFTDFLRFIADTGMNVNVEMKANEHSGAMALQLVETLVRELRTVEGRCAPGALPQIIVSSFSAVQLYEFHRQAPEFATGLLFEARTLGFDSFAAAQMCGASFLHVEDAGLPEPVARLARERGLGAGIGQGVTPELIALAGDHGLGVNVWTVNSRERAEQLFSWGATGVFTDIADELMA